MYMDLRQKYWWTRMKGDIVEYVAQCDTCRRVKAKHQRPVGLPKTSNGHDSIWVIVDRQMKVAHFIPVKIDYKGNKLAQLYIDNILRLHGVPSRIVSDRGT